MMQWRRRLLLATKAALHLRRSSMRMTNQIFFFIQGHPYKVRRQEISAPAAVLFPEQVPNQEVLPQASEIGPRPIQDGETQEGPMNLLTATLQESIHLHILGITLWSPVQHRESLPPAGRLMHYYGNWIMITSDSWVLKSVQGYHLELMRQPVQRMPPTELHLSEIAQKHINAVVEKLIQKEAVVVVNAVSGILQCQRKMAHRGQW